MYKIPKDEEILQAIFRVLDKNKEVRSQALFHRLVLEELKRKSPYYTASSERIKRTAALKGVKIFVEKRKSEKEAKSCFVCGSPLKTVRVKSLTGEDALAGKKCNACGFRMDKGNLIPSRYTFYK